MVQIIAPMVQKVPQGTSVFYVHDGNDEKFSSAMMQQLQQIGARDLTVTDQFWICIGNH
jgi:precorrin-4 methylase